LEANALFQAGQGSGADVAAAVRGGVVEVRRGAAGLAVASRTLPAGLHLVAGWTGSPAPTTPLLVRFATAPTPAAPAALSAAAVAPADAAARGDAGALLAAAERWAALLVRLGAELALPLVTPALATLVRTANRVGAAAKPSGAGAGDCGIALATSAAQAAAVRAAWQDAGILPLPVQVAERGGSLGLADPRPQTRAPPAVPASPGGLCAPDGPAGGGRAGPRRAPRARPRRGRRLDRAARQAPPCPPADHRHDGRDERGSRHQPGARTGRRGARHRLRARLAARHAARAGARVHLRGAHPRADGAGARQLGHGAGGGAPVGRGRAAPCEGGRPSGLPAAPFRAAP